MTKQLVKQSPWYTIPFYKAMEEWKQETWSECLKWSEKMMVKKWEITGALEDCIMIPF